MQQQWVVRDQTGSGGSRIVIVGNDRNRIENAFCEFTTGVSTPDETVVTADGGIPPEYAPSNTYEGEQSVRGIDLDDILRNEDIDRVVLAFHKADRESFFPILQYCIEYGTEAIIPADQAQKVLVAETHDEWVVLDLEPVSPWQQKLKRAFDIAFALIGLIALAPLIVVIAGAIKIDSRGPVLYKQQRSGLFGQPFQCCKFRTMSVGNEDTTPKDDSENNRITRVGHVLRKTHMDEIPQLWSILRGEMTTVGPRAAWVEEEEEVLEQEVETWPKRWFVKPGLTGLAQINEVTSIDGDAKLRYDLEYVRRQSLLLDIWIIAVQLSMVLTDVIELLNRSVREP